MSTGEPVAALIRRVAERELLSRFRALRDDQIFDKGDGEWVTEADLASERALIHGLEALQPGMPVVGEERSHGRPEELERLCGQESLWIVDPLDGTRHFAAGEPYFGIMVSRVADDIVEEAWIHLPVAKCMVHGSRGGGVTIDGVPRRLDSDTIDGPLRGALHTRFVPEPQRARFESLRRELGGEPRHSCAAQRYMDILAGVEQFALYYRTLPWDHAAGAMLVEEAGGCARRWDGTRYAPSDIDGVGLLVAATQQLWDELAKRLPLEVG